MEIIRTSRDNIDKLTLYKMTTSPEVKGMKLAVGQTLELQDWMIYSVIDQKTGEERQVLSVLTKDGDMFATNSASFIDAFTTAAECLQELFKKVRVIQGTSRNGRNFITCAAE